MLYKTLFMAACGTLLLSACGHGGGHTEADDGHSHETETRAKEEAGHADEIVIDAKQAKASGIVVETVVPGEFCGVIPCGGKILAAQGDEATVVATVAGIVKPVRGMAEGSPVGKGAAVFTISSDKLQVTQKDFNAIRADYEAAKAAYEAFAQGGGSQPGVAVKSPIGGYVKTCLVKEGDYVSVGQPMMTVTQTRSLYLRANVPERYYTQMGTLHSAKFKTAYGDRVYSLAQMNGRLVATGKQTGDGSPYIPVTFEFANRADVPTGTFVETYLLTAPRQGVVTVPVSALTDEQGLNFVYIQTDPTCYERREVTVGQTDGERVEIKSGLKAGEKVVAKGAVQVRLAGASNTIPGHTHNH